jgi:broad specificity phosphatase PhoE
MECDVDVVVVFETHSTTLDNEAGLASGWFDVALSARGEEQARMLGARRRDDHLAAVFCSDLARAFRTAEIAFSDRALPIVRDARLRECDYGNLTRRPTLEIEAQRALHLATPFPNGESYQQVVRVSPRGSRTSPVNSPDRRSS